MKRVILLAVMLVLAISIFATGNKENNVQGDYVSTKEYVFDFNGEQRVVEVPNNPKRIAVIGFDTLDIIDALGFKENVVAVVDPTGPLLPHYLNEYRDFPSAGPLWGDDLEAVAGVKPDLIIASARTFKSFDSLSEIAPAVYFTIPGMGTPYKDELFKNIRAISFLLDAKDKGEVLIKEIDTKIMKLKNVLSKIENPRALFLIVTGKTIGLYSDDEKSRYGFVFNEFGFNSAATAEEIKKDSAEHGESISFEFISAKNPNYLLVIDRGAGTGESSLTAKDTLDNVLVKGTDAYKNNNIIYLDATSWYISNGGISSTHIMLDNLLSVIK